jgi:hypothetical protein
MQTICVRRSLRVALIGLVIGASVAPVGSQTRYLTDSPGTWKPWKSFSAIASTRADQAVNAAQVAAFEAELVALNAILRRAPGVASPVGFSVETWGNLAGYRPKADAPAQPARGTLPIAGALTFGAFPIFEYERNGKMIREDTGETALQQFIVNDIGRGVLSTGNVSEWGDLDHDAFMRPMPNGEIAGLPRYGDGVVIAKNPDALWAPLSLGAALELVALNRRNIVRSFQESLDKFTARLAALRDPAKRAQRAKATKDASVSMKDPAAYIAQMEEVARIEEASLEREVGPAAGTGKGLADAQRALDEVTAWLAELSPAGGAAPSCYAEAGRSLRAKFREAPDRGCVPLVRPNYAYFDKSLPRSAPQVVIITPINRCFDTANKYNTEANSSSPAGCRANRRLLETFDRDAVRAWIR